MSNGQIDVVESNSDDGIAVVGVKGGIVTKIEGTRLAQSINDVLENADPPHVVLDLSDIKYIDSFSFGWIIRTMNAIKDKGGEFAICCPNEEIVYLFGLTNFGKTVPVYSTEHNARQAILTGDDSKRIMCS